MSFLKLQKIHRVHYIVWNEKLIIRPEIFYGWLLIVVIIETKGLMIELMSVTAIVVHISYGDK